MVLAQNLVALRDHKFSAMQNETQRNRALAKASDTTLSQIQRIVKLDLAPGIDLVERLASALDVRPFDMLTPYFASQLLSGREPILLDAPPPISTAPPRLPVLHPNSES